MNKETKQDIDFQDICFGLNRKTDEQSLIGFLKLFSRDKLLQAIVPRLDDDEIIDIVDRLTAVLRRHLQEGEYHELFLGDPDHHH
jgi:TorA maturation chaperone TorD